MQADSFRDEVEIGMLRSIAQANPQSLSGEQKNALIRANIAARNAAAGRVDSDLERFASRETVQEGVINDWDPDQNLGPMAGGSRYMTAITGDRRKRYAKRKELPPHVRDAVQKVANQLWDGNPLARRFLIRGVNYLLGDSYQVTAEHEDDKTREALQEILDRSWQDPRNRLARRLPGWIMSYENSGELAVRATVNESNGAVRLAFIGSDQIVDVKSEDLDIQSHSELLVKKPTQEGVEDPDVLKIIRVPEDDVLKDKDDAQRLQGEAFYWAANVLPDMVRGRPSQLVVADLLDADDQLLWNLLEREALSNAFIWDVTLTGASPQTVEKWRNENKGVPKPGSIQVHNESVIWEPKSADLKVNDAVSRHDLVMSVIALAHGHPAMWYAADSDPNRANGENLTGPTLRDLGAKQREIRWILEDIACFILDQGLLKDKALAAKVKGTLTSKLIKIDLPDLSVNDQSAAADTMGKLVNAISAAVQASLMPKDVGIRMLVLQATQLGVEETLEHWLELLEEDAKEKEAEMGPYPAGGMPPGPGGALPAPGQIPQPGQQLPPGAQPQQPQQPGRPPLAVPNGRRPAFSGSPPRRPDGSSRPTIPR